MSKALEAPIVSVIVANYNCEKYLEAALHSALDQTITSLEVIFVDDCSSDGSVQRARVLAEKDSRLQVVALSKNGGPSHARNVAIEKARGQWLAVLDSDDLMHPQRLERLLEHARNTGADIVADDLLVFYSDGDQPHSFLGDNVEEPFDVSVVDYIDSNHISGRKRNSLGFLKPLIRRRSLVEWELRYDERLTNSEDYDLVLRLLLKGGKYSIDPFPGYFYRKHDKSISHRLGESTLKALLVSDDSVRRSEKNLDTAVVVALNRRRRSIVKAIELLNVVAVLKSGSLLAIARQLVRAPGAFLLLKSVAEDKWRRLLSKGRFEGMANLVSDSENDKSRDAIRVLEALVRTG